MSFLELYPHIIWRPDPELYDCSNRTMEEWVARGTPKPIHGWFSIAFGIITLILYILTILAISNREFLKNSCYQMMYFASINDVINLINSNIVSGYYLVVGATFCTHPVSNYTMGAIACGGWCGLCVAVISLGFGRLAEVTGSGKWMFQGKMVVFWMFLSVFASFFVAFLTHPAVFNSTAGAWFFAPFIVDDLELEIHRYPNVVLPVFNICTANIVLSTYVFIFIYLRFRQNGSGGEKKFSKLQKKLLLQCTIICSILALTCYLYVYLLLFEAPMWVVALAQACYQLSECTPLISYLVFNATIRNKVVTMIGLKKYAYATSVVSTAPLSTTNAHRVTSTTE